MTLNVPVNQITDGVILTIRAIPGAKQDKVMGLMPLANNGCALKVSVTTAPENGKANQAIIELLATFLNLPKRTISVYKGQTDRHKLIQIMGDPHLLYQQCTEILTKLKQT